MWALDGCGLWMDGWNELLRSARLTCDWEVDRRDARLAEHQGLRSRTLAREGLCSARWGNQRPWACLAKRPMKETRCKSTCTT